MHSGRHVRLLPRRQLMRKSSNRRIIAVTTVKEVRAGKQTWKYTCGKRSLLPVYSMKRSSHETLDWRSPLLASKVTAIVEIQARDITINVSKVCGVAVVPISQLSLICQSIIIRGCWKAESRLHNKRRLVPEPLLLNPFWGKLRLSDATCGSCQV